MTKNLFSYSAEILPPFSRQNDIRVAIALYPRRVAFRE